MLLDGCILQLFPSQTSQNKQVFMLMCHKDERTDQRFPACFPAGRHPQSRPAINTLTHAECLHAPSFGRSLSSPPGVRQSRGPRRAQSFWSPQPQSHRLIDQAPLAKANMGDMNVTTVYKSRLDLCKCSDLCYDWIES